MSSAAAAPPAQRGRFSRRPRFGDEVGLAPIQTSRLRRRGRLRLPARDDRIFDQGPLRTARTYKSKVFTKGDPIPKRKTTPRASPGSSASVVPDQ
jgi:hypothetical protein